ncbi:hypothetical protein [Bacillus massilinigeriensis]|uniref:hypothetical protein n=1 Tax=Bacillus mediterraneensis TaxID=1805474 RepID=UPI0008F96D7F|nr:hypothetical protein [Bacillus mediterraneensis]
MIKNKKLFYISLVFFVASFVLNFPFPHEGPYGETIALAFSIPISSADGLQYVGIVSIVLLITSLILLAKSIKKYRGGVIWLAFAIAVFAPSMMATAYQQTLGTDIYAITYEQDQSNCEFKMTNEKTLQGECKLPFENYSNKAVQFTVGFYEKYYFEEDVPMISLMNNNAPYVVKLKGNEKKTVKLKSSIDVSELKEHIGDGSASGVNIFIKSGEKVRRL